MLDVYPIRLRFISAKFLASAPPICKRRFRTVMDAATEHPQRIRTDTDVREIKQQRVYPANSTLNSVHGRTLFNSAMDGGGSIQYRVAAIYNIHVVNCLASFAKAKHRFCLTRPPSVAVLNKNSKLKNVHGCTFFSDAILGSSG